MRVVCLGSGSSGNSLVVRAGRTTVLVDAGFGPRDLVSRLRQAGCPPRQISAIVLTHEHADHARGAAAFAAQHQIPLGGDPRTLDAVRDQANARSATWVPTSAPTPAPAPRFERIEFAVGTAARIGDLEVRSFAISHDAVAPCGYVLSSGAWHVCIATDTGEAGAAVVEAMRGAHLLVIEANHDTDRLIKGPYPWPLKKRILSPTGHLSNEQAARALLSALDDGPRWIWLAHLSRTNNTPDLARGGVAGLLRREGLRQVPLQVAPPGTGPVWDSADLLGAPRQAELPTPIAAAITSSAD
ncbi:MAG TPA: MBL fold metallo-hydrolase [Ktedonobacterales bacterium]